MSRELRVMFAHTAAECPDRENCWAAPIHDQYASRDRLVAKQCDCFPHGPDEPCICHGCWACAGHVVGCACDVAWDCEHEPGEHAHAFIDTAIGRLCVTCRKRPGSLG